MKKDSTDVVARPDTKTAPNSTVHDEPTPRPASKQRRLMVLRTMIRDFEAKNMSPRVIRAEVADMMIRWDLAYPTRLDYLRHLGMKE